MDSSESEDAKSETPIYAFAHHSIFINFNI
jgi:hypothetical protein